MPEALGIIFMDYCGLRTDVRVDYKHWTTHLGKDKSVRVICLLKLAWKQFLCFGPDPELLKEP